MSRTLVTGHTGFKGSWLCHRLAAEGKTVAGFSLPATSDSHYVKSETHRLLDKEIIGDIRDLELLEKAIESFKPDQVIHLAAQAIVSTSTADPFATISTNVEGTNALISAAVKKAVPRVLIVTSDKVYKDKDDMLGKSESADLGGHDPYSASKAAADIISQAWATVQDETIISIARGGNVLGGGDRGDDRLIPDFERALNGDNHLTVRNPKQVRPWQHVLDCLDGYLKILNHPTISSGDAWNVGPVNQTVEAISVEELLEIYAQARGSRPEISHVQSHFKETDVLQIDTSRISKELSWTPLYDSIEVITETAKWERKVAQGISTPAVATTDQLHSYLQRRNGSSAT